MLSPQLTLGNPGYSTSSRNRTQDLPWLSPCDLYDVLFFIFLYCIWCNIVIIVFFVKQLCCPHFFPYFSPQLFSYFSIYYSVQLAYIIWQIIVYMYRARIMREFICFYLLSMYSILVKSIYNMQNSRPRYSAIHTIFWHGIRVCVLNLEFTRFLVFLWVFSDLALRALGFSHRGSRI